MKQEIRLPRTTRNAWLQSIYDRELVDASTTTRLLSDKLFMYRCLNEKLGTKKLLRFHPKTVGLRELAQKWKWLSASTSVATLKENLKEEFPFGFIVKPAAIINSEGERGGYYFSEQEFIKDFLLSGSVARMAAEEENYFSDLLACVASGERLVLQENILSRFGVQITGAKEIDEIRVHTFEDRVVRHGTYSRWAVRPVRNQNLRRNAEEFVEEFLKELPKDFLRAQAWGLDIAILPNSDFQIIEINTNRGEKKLWSGFLSRPGLIGAYTRHFERHYSLRFSGWRGAIVRLGFGNTLKNLKKRHIEGIR